MKQRISHGATIDTATPQEISDIVAGTLQRQPDKAYYQEKGSIQLDGTGAGTATLRLSRLFGWLMERITMTSSPAAAALIQVFENGTQGTDMREVIQLSAAGLYSDSFDNRLYIPPGSQVFVVCSAGPIGGSLSFNLQIELIKAAT